MLIFWPFIGDVSVSLCVFECCYLLHRDPTLHLMLCESCGCSVCALVLKGPVYRSASPVSVLPHLNSLHPLLLHHNLGTDLRGALTRLPSRLSNILSPSL